MSDKISHAFDHPEARAAARPDALADRISLRDHIVSVEIGAFQVERGVSQRLAFNLVVEVKPPEASLNDDVDNILSYDMLTDAVALELAAERVNLLETLAERIAARILQEPQAERIFLRIEKLDRGPGALGVEIVRSTGANPTEQDNRPQPLMAFIPVELLSDPNLPDALERLGKAKHPTVLVVGAQKSFQSGDAQAQRRIDLLAIEQNAWALAGLTPDLKVVATRTELDWAIRQGGVYAWAPSKLVLDSAGGPKGPVEAPSLAIWFANEMRARDLLFVEQDVPNEAPLGRRVSLDALL